MKNNQPISTIKQSPSDKAFYICLDIFLVFILLVVVVLFLCAQLGGINKDCPLARTCAVLVNEDDGNAGTGGGKDVGGHADHATQPLLLDQFLTDGFLQR